MQKLTASPFGFKADCSSSSAGRNKKPWAEAKLLTGNALAAPTCPTLPPAKQVETLTGAKPPAVSHVHQSPSQMLFAITAYRHGDAKRPQAGILERYPSTQGTTEPQRGQEPPRMSPPPPDALLAAVPWHRQSRQPSPAPAGREKLSKDCLKLFFASSQWGCSPGRCHCLILSGSAGKGGEHQRTQLLTNPITASTALLTCRRGNGS